MKYIGNIRWNSPRRRTKLTAPAASGLISLPHQPPNPVIVSNGPALDRNQPGPTNAPRYRPESESGEGASRVVNRSRMSARESWFSCVAWLSICSNFSALSLKNVHLILHRNTSKLVIVKCSNNLTNCINIVYYNQWVRWWCGVQPI